LIQRKHFHLSVAVCKEKWRNLRTVFLRHLRKKTPSGSQADHFSKKYYLNDALQFLMPFIKSGRKQIGNLTAPQSDTEIRDVNVFDYASEDENSNQTVNVEEVEAVHDKSISSPIHNTSSNNISLQKSKKKNVTKETDVDRCFIEYFNNKKKKQKIAVLMKSFY